MDLLRYREVAELLDVSKSTVERIVKDGDLRAVKVRGQRRVMRDDLASYVASLTELPRAVAQ